MYALRYLEPLFKIAGKNENAVRNYAAVVYMGEHEAAVTDGFGLLTVAVPDLGKNETVNKNNLPSSVKYPNYKGILNSFSACSVKLDTSALMTSLKATGGSQPKDLPFYLGNRDGKLVVGQAEDFGEHAFNPWLIKSFMWPLQKLVKGEDVEADISPNGEFLILKQGPYTLYVIGVCRDSERKTA